MTLVFVTSSVDILNDSILAIFPDVWAEPHSSVDSVQDLRRGGCWFDPLLSQCSFRGLMIVVATRFIPFSPLSFQYFNSYMRKQPVARGLIKEHQESMDKCTGFNNITEILLKMALKTIQSFNPDVVIPLQKESFWL